MFTYGMSAIGLSDDIDGEGADGVNGEVVGRKGGETGHRSQRSLGDDEEEDGDEQNGHFEASPDCTSCKLTHDLRESPPRSPAHFARDGLEGTGDAMDKSTMSQPENTTGGWPCRLRGGPRPRLRVL